MSNWKIEFASRLADSITNDAELKERLVSAVVLRLRKIKHSTSTHVLTYMREEAQARGIKVCKMSAEASKYYDALIYSEVHRKPVDRHKAKKIDILASGGAGVMVKNAVNEYYEGSINQTELRQTINEAMKHLNDALKWL